MNENGTWHFPIHDVLMKTDNNGNITEVKKDDKGNIEIIKDTDTSVEYTKIKISNIILAALENNEENILDRINKIYGKTIHDIINGIDKKVTYQKPINNRYNGPTIEESEEIESNESLNNQEVNIYLSYNHLGEVLGVVYNEEKKVDSETYTKITITKKELKEIQDINNDYKDVINNLNNKYKIVIFKEIQTLDEGIKSNILNFLEKFKNLILKDDNNGIIIGSKN